MIALDTNVLVRFLVDDDPDQSARARRVVESATAAGDQLFVADVVVCETVWVLSSCYHQRRAAIAAVLDSLFRSGELVFRSTDSLAAALRAYRGGRGDFADYLIRETAGGFGAGPVLTFDRDLLDEGDRVGGGFEAP